MRPALFAAAVLALGCNKPKPTEPDPAPTVQLLTSDEAKSRGKAYSAEEEAEQRILEKSLDRFHAAALPEDKKRHRTAVLASLKRLRQIWDGFEDVSNRRFPPLEADKRKMFDDKLKNLRERADAIEAEVK